MIFFINNNFKNCIEDILCLSFSLLIIYTYKNIFLSFESFGDIFFYSYQYKFIPYKEIIPTIVVILISEYYLIKTTFNLEILSILNLIKRFLSFIILNIILYGYQLKIYNEEYIELVDFNMVTIFSLINLKNYLQIFQNKETKINSQNYKLIGYFITSILYIFFLYYAIYKYIENEIYQYFLYIICITFFTIFYLIKNKMPLNKRKLIDILINNIYAFFLLSNFIIFAYKNFLLKELILSIVISIYILYLFTRFSIIKQSFFTFDKIKNDKNNVYQQNKTINQKLYSIIWQILILLILSINLSILGIIFN
ncbi:MAG: hypothetical protein U1E31_02005 [Rickettsiales bacterium]